MRLTRLSLVAAPVLLAATLVTGCSDSGDSDSGSSGSSGSSEPGYVEVDGEGAAFTFEDMSVAEGWTVRAVKRSAGMDEVTSPEIRGEVTNEGDEPAYALFEMVFAKDGEPVSTVKCSSREIEPGATVDLLCPGLGMPMPKGHDQVVVQEITRGTSS